MQLVKLFCIRRRRAVRHKLRRVLDLRERNYVSETVCAKKLHNKPVKTEAHTAVRGRAEFEGVGKISEFSVCLFVLKTEKREYPLLKDGIGDSYRTA